MSENHIRHSSRHAIDPAAAQRMDTSELRANFHIAGLFEPGRVNLTYTHYDGMIVGGATPVDAALALDAIRPTGTKSFLERRELIAVNIGGAGSVTVDGTRHALAPRDMIYVGMGAAVSFASDDPGHPAKFYLLSAPAHTTHPTRLIRIGDASNSISAARRRETSARSFSSSTPRG